MTLKYIAELCQNHLGKFENIEKMVEECAYNGAKIIKLQYILAKNLSYRPVFDHGLNDGNNKLFKAIFISLAFHVIFAIFWFFFKGLNYIF